ncbi:HDIG domain-containing metalloprotein [Synechococcus sp. CBW1004]|uniref:HDIG domain-containing metalloprotein n=1 Tax=Synechococcus sp. CBW1004 TaxID=1353136 RepID=UPI0018CF8D54|nr:HDIG domain-containing metalloprotein [Synechococcus sp. CBW1004]QPN64787.1 HDIG domain-containing protein [Synechococcus sp. CBW1004]
MAHAMRRLRSLWRGLLRLERPRQAIVCWRPAGMAAMLLACLLVALLTSWPWLVEPSLRPGLPAPFTVRAPRDATVMDSAALEQRRSQMVPRTTVQVIDERLTRQLQDQLERLLEQVRQQRVADQTRIDPLNLTAAERRWLRGLDPNSLASWEDGVRRAQNRMLRQGVAGTLADAQLLEAAGLQLEDQAREGRQLGSRLVVRSLQGRSNLRSDPFLSQQRIEELLSRNGLPTITVRRGDLVVRQGEKITPQAFDVLDAFGLINRRPRPLAWLAHVSEALAVSGVMLLVMRRWRASLEPRQALLALATLLVVQACKLWLGLLVSPLALLVPPTLLLAQGLGTVAGLAWLAAASLLWPFPLNGVLECRLIVATLVAVLAAVLAGRQRNRAQLLQLAVLLPLGALAAQAAVLQLAALLGLAGGSEGELPSNAELMNEAWLVASLLLAGLILAPLVESFFGLLTRARLMELADLERPLLRRLSTEAPGTFEHTLMICGLAEEGARAIHADVDLIRTGALYHDVGKMHGPQWFIENQDERSGNPHDRLDDPFASASILQAHVDEGLKLARRYRLPRPLADFIPEHQGTLKMGYFLHRARELDPSVSEERFRYRGPTPRSRETAILMLADGCEAALRSLPPDTTEDQARQMVRRIVEARQADGQLAGSGISRAELELVIRAFVRVWRRMRHRRIPYPIPARKAFSA